MFLSPKSQAFDRSRARHLAPSRKHVVARWVMFAIYVVLSVGLPIPATGLPISGEVFPCMHHRCGCHSAEKCWRDCCCMSLEKKLAWAKQNGITPPPYVLAEARSHGIVDAPGKTKCCCCEVRPAASCCQSSPKDPDCNAGHPAAPRGRLASQPADSSILLVEALRCHGIGDNWIGAGICLPVSVVDCQIFFPQVARLVEPIMQLTSWAAAPPTRPPTSSAA
jgi:hypothetical protein